MKKAITFGSVLLIVLGLFSTCFAATPSGDLAGFVQAYEASINPNTIWGSLTLLMPIIVTSFLFAFVWGRIKKNSKKTANTGKFGL